MALTCTQSVQVYEAFEFIDCTTISISYSVRGTATVGFTVISTTNTGLVNDYNNITLGGVSFRLTVKDADVSVIPGTLVYQYRLSFLGFGC